MPSSRASALVQKPLVGWGLGLGPGRLTTPGRLAGQSVVLRHAYAYAREEVGLD